MWEKINTHPNYEVSDCGKVRRGKNELTPAISKDGYAAYRLYKEGVQSHHRAHRLVAKAFIPNPENKPQVNHKDSDKLNNHVSNLEWCTQAENMSHAVDNGAYSNRSGENSSAPKLSWWQVERIRLMREIESPFNPITSSKVASLFNVKRSTIKAIWSGRNWKGTALKNTL